MPTITPFLWVDNRAEEAANVYASIFPDAKVHRVVRAPADYPRGAKGKVLTVDFELLGQRFTGLNGGPEFTFTEAVSFLVSCDTQEEVNRYWDALSADGQPGPCGWLKDRFGLSWQVAPRLLFKLLSDPDPRKSAAVMQAMMKMSKIEIASLQQAYDAA